jgi:hypothetical protein
MGLRDSAGQLLDGQSTYRLRVPAVVPAKDFWSAIVYDMDSKAFVCVEPCDTADVAAAAFLTLLLGMPETTTFAIQTGPEIEHDRELDPDADDADADLDRGLGPRLGASATPSSCLALDDDLDG